MKQNSFEKNNEGHLHQKLIHYKSETLKYKKRLQQIEGTYNYKKITELMEQNDLILQHNKFLEKTCRQLKFENQRLFKSEEKYKRRVNELSETMWKLEESKKTLLDEMALLQNDRHMKEQESGTAFAAGENEIKEQTEEVANMAETYGQVKDIPAIQPEVLDEHNRSVKAKMFQTLHASEFDQNNHS